MTEEVIEIIRPHLTDYQKQILYSPARFTITKAATKTGKTFSHLWWLFEKACNGKKQGANYWWVAPVFGQAEIAFNRLRRVLGGSSDFKINLTKLSIETPIGSFIHFKSAENPDSLYGEDVFAAVFDEFTRAKEDAWFALRSTLTHTKGPCKMIGNPKGRKNWGYRLAEKAKAGEPGYEFHKITAYDAINAGILSADEVAQAKRDLPDYVFRELYEAEDNDDKSNPFGMDFIARQVKPISDLMPVCFGIDLAKSVDWTVVTGLDNNGDVCFFDRWQGDWGFTKAKILQIIAWTPTLIDATGIGNPIVEDLQKAGANVEGYVFSSTSKQKLMQGLASAIQNAEISLIEGAMRSEVESFEYISGPSGVKYEAPAGSHDDCVMSLGLAREIFRQTPNAPSFGVTR